MKVKQIGDVSVCSNHRGTYEVHIGTTYTSKYKGSSRAEASGKVVKYLPEEQAIVAAHHNSGRRRIMRMSGFCSRYLKMTPPPQKPRKASVATAAPHPDLASDLLRIEAKLDRLLDIWTPKQNAAE